MVFYFFYFDFSYCHQLCIQKLGINKCDCYLPSLYNFGSKKMCKSFIDILCVRQVYDNAYSNLAGYCGEELCPRGIFFVIVFFLDVSHLLYFISLNFYIKLARYLLNIVSNASKMHKIKKN